MEFINNCVISKRGSAINFKFCSEKLIPVFLINLFFNSLNFLLSCLILLISCCSKEISQSDNPKSLSMISNPGKLFFEEELNNLDVYICLEIDKTASCSIILLEIYKIQLDTLSKAKIPWYKFLLIS